MLLVVVAGLCIVLFSALSALHVYWALGGQAGLDKAVPSIDGQPAFQPGALLTGVVALVLMGCAGVAAVLGFSHLIHVPYAYFAPYAGAALAVIFAVRAVGDFKLVGFFKSIKGSAFASYDTKVYSPLCVALSGGFVYLSLGANA